MKDQPTHLAKIIIEDDGWIGANTSILPRITFGKRRIAGTGAVINKDIPRCSVAVGVPQE